MGKRPVRFKKMHGLGNDFVVVDARDGGPVTVPPALAVALADRHRGVGFDQLAIVAEGASHEADLHLTFLNADGTQSAACGNATRCIADHEMRSRDVSALAIHVEGRGRLDAQRGADGYVAVNMGHPELGWSGIPLAQDVDTLHLPIEGAPTATGMGNPHCSFFVDDVEGVDLEARGAEIEHHPLFPQRTNVQFVQVTGPDRLRMRVWERGTGVTLASGSSSCAVTVAAARRGLTGRRVAVDLDGGTLQVDWRDDGVWMSGPTALVFEAELSADFLATI